MVSQNARQDLKVWWFIEDKSEKSPKPQHAMLPDVMPHSHERAHNYTVPELACIYSCSAYRYSQRNVDPPMISYTLSRSCTRPLGTMTALLYNVYVPNCVGGESDAIAQPTSRRYQVESVRLRCQASLQEFFVGKGVSSC